MHVLLPNAEPSFLVADRLTTDLAHRATYDLCFHEANCTTFQCQTGAPKLTSVIIEILRCGSG